MKITLNKEEIAIGASIGITYILMLGAWCLVSVPLCALFWAMGGSRDAPRFLFLSSRHWRRIGVPVVLSTVAYIATGNWLVLASILLLFGVCTLGYGIPTITAGVVVDKGSWLGRFFYYGIAEGNEAVATAYTRATYALLIGLSMITLVATSGFLWFIGTGLLVLLMPIVVQLVEGEIVVGHE